MHADRIFPVALLVTAAVTVFGIAILYWYFAPHKRDFGAVYVELGISSLPTQLERLPQIETRLDQLSREPCYGDAVIGLARGLLDQGYPRESATSLRSFAKRCGNPERILPLAYEGLERIGDFVGALDVANELVEASPANGSFRYWRAITYDKMGDFPHAVTDYLSRIQLVGDQKSLLPDVFYKLSRVYDALGRPCDAITPIEIYVSLDPSTRRTPQIIKIIADYAAKGNCDTRYATGTARVSFAATTDVRTLTVLINGVAGTFILDTGATLIFITPQFAAKARVVAEPGHSIISKTVGGTAISDIAYASTVSVGKAEASGVVVAVLRNGSNPFGNKLDGLLGMSFLSRFNVTLSPSVLELQAIRLR
jgi:hypothetical protein